MARPAPALFFVCAVLLTAGRHEPRTAQAENAAAALSATPITDPEAVKQAVGDDLGNHYILMQVQVTPKTSKPLPVHVDDFLLRTDKDGEKTTPFVPSQMTGSAALVTSQVLVHANGVQNEQSGPVFSGMPGSGKKDGAPASPANLKQANKGKDDPLRKTLIAKMLPEKEITQSASGLLYFPMEKQKLKDLELIYTTPEGKLSLRFK